MNAIFMQEAKAQSITTNLTILAESPLFRHLGYDEETPSNSHLYVLSIGISNETNIDNNKDIQVSGDSEGGASDDGATSHGGNLPNLYDPCVGDSSGVMPTQIYFSLF